MTNNDFVFSLDLQHNINQLADKSTLYNVVQFVNNYTNVTISYKQKVLKILKFEDNLDLIKQNITQLIKKECVQYKINKYIESIIKKSFL